MKITTKYNVDFKTTVTAPIDGVQVEVPVEFKMTDVVTELEFDGKEVPGLIRDLPSIIRGIAQVARDTARDAAAERAERAERFNEARARVVVSSTPTQSLADDLVEALTGHIGGGR